MFDCLLVRFEYLILTRFDFDLLASQDTDHIFMKCIVIIPDPQRTNAFGDSPDLSLSPTIMPK